MILPSGFVRLLEDEFVRQVKAFARLPYISNATWHQKNLAEQKRDWLTIYSDDSCFVCYGSRPQYGLLCGHTVCANCVRRLGTKTDAWIFAVDRCFLCRLETPEVSVKFRPPTATVRLLSIDGGGVRGIIPLVFLQGLEDKIGLPYPVQENFHYIIGTSIGQYGFIRESRLETNPPCLGGIIALALGQKG